MANGFKCALRTKAVSTLPVIQASFAAPENVAAVAAVIELASTRVAVRAVVIAVFFMAFSRVDEYAREGANHVPGRGKPDGPRNACESMHRGAVRIPKPGIRIAGFVSGYGVSGPRYALRRLYSVLRLMPSVSAAAFLSPAKCSSVSSISWRSTSRIE